MQMFNPAHRGEVLKEAYLDPLGMSVTEFARRIGISRKCASELVNKHAGVSVEMAHRLAKATDNTAESWLVHANAIRPMGSKSSQNSESNSRSKADV